MNTICIRPKLYLLIALGLAAFVSPPDLLAIHTPDKTLKFYHTHTGKSLEVTFSRGQEYDPAALRAVNAFLKDFRNGEAIPMDPALLDWLYDLRESLDSDGTYEVISAYRSPQTNNMLRNKSSGVARRSQHLLGKAIDVRLDDVPVGSLHKAALQMQRGGVGYYPASKFVHLDTGRVRRW